MFFEKQSILPTDASVTNRENPAAEGRDQYGVGRPQRSMKHFSGKTGRLNCEHGGVTTLLYELQPTAISFSSKCNGCCKSLCTTPPTVPRGESPCAANSRRMGGPEQSLLVPPEHAMIGLTCRSLHHRRSEPPWNQPNVKAVPMADATIGDQGHGRSANCRGN